MFEAFRKRQKKWWCSRSNLPQTTFLDGKTLFLVLMKAPYMDGICLRESYWQQFSAWSATGNAFLIFFFLFYREKKNCWKVEKEKRACLSFAWQQNTTQRWILIGVVLQALPASCMASDCWAAQRRALPSMWGQTSWPAPLPSSHSPSCSDWNKKTVKTL